MSRQTNAAKSPRATVIHLVADSDLNRHVLKNCLLDAGYHVQVAIGSSQVQAYFSSDNYSEPDLWLVDSEDSDEDAVAFIIERSEATLLANDDIPAHGNAAEFNNWQQRLLNKLDVTASLSPQLSPQHRTTRFEKVWVLAASLGGPDAVRRFLNTLLPDLPIALVYAQHTEQDSEKPLVATVGRDTNYPLELAVRESALARACVTVLPVDKQVRFLDHGALMIVDEKWQGDYQPAIDQVIAELARVYGERLGVIVFSGLCDDGKAGCRIAQACGATIWAQSIETCASGDMPAAVINTGFVTRQGSPEQLARALNERMAES